MPTPPALVPLATLAANPFADLTGGPHDDNIDAIYTAGITKGCDPTAYCPSKNVTREEMVSFLARTAGLGSNPPIANALTAQKAATVQTASEALSANIVGGHAPSGLLRTARGIGAGKSPFATTFQTLPTVTLTAPGPGIVLVDSTLIAGNSPTGINAIQFRLRDTTSGTFSPSSEIAKTVGAGEVYEVTVNLVYAFAIDAGGPRTL